MDHLDPFLLFDHFGSNDPRDYLKGFPMHPHRGIETVTYVLAGKVRHTDSLGNSGEIGPGDLQWMTAGRSILHEEMPQGIGDYMEGFQLWVNLPTSEKMSPARYQEVPAAKIPWINQEKGITVRLIAGEYGGKTGPINQIAVAPTYLDVWVEAGSTFTYDTDDGQNCFAYLFKGGADFCGTTVEGTNLIVFGSGKTIKIKGGLFGSRFLLIAGKPIGEPIVRYGPIVMNTREEIEVALKELRSGTFLKD
jgi:redox-sensitive bicupin YhaK (pirin superfamily)